MWISKCVKLLNILISEHTKLGSKNSDLPQMEIDFLKYEPTNDLFISIFFITKFLAILLPRYISIEDCIWLVLNLIKFDWKLSNFDNFFDILNLGKQYTTQLGKNRNNVSATKAVCFEKSPEQFLRFTSCKHSRTIYRHGSMTHFLGHKIQFINSSLLCRSNTFFKKDRHLDNFIFDAAGLLVSDHDSGKDSSNAYIFSFVIF